MHAYKNKTADVIKDFFEIQTLKRFVAQTIALIEKLLSHKRFLATRSSNLDPMLICFDDFFFGVKSYQAQAK